MQIDLPVVVGRGIPQAVGRQPMGLKRLLLTLLVCWTCVVGSYAQRQKQPTRSESIKGQAPSATGWKRTISTSEMDDTVQLLYTISAEKVIKGWLAASNPVLGARCLKNEASLVVITLPVRVERVNRIRFDEEPAEDIFWNNMPNDTGFIASMPQYWAAKMLKAQRVRLEFTPVNAPPAVADFRLAGFEKAYQELSKQCPWIDAR
jgi:hypothetical protein